MKRIVIVVFALLIAFSCKTIFAGQFKFPGKKVKTNKTVYIDMNSDGVKDAVKLVKGKKGTSYYSYHYTVYVNNLCVWKAETSGPTVRVISVSKKKKLLFIFGQIPGGQTKNNGFYRITRNGYKILFNTSKFSRFTIKYKVKSKNRISILSQNKIDFGIGSFVYWNDFKIKKNKFKAISKYKKRVKNPRWIDGRVADYKLKKKIPLYSYKNGKLTKKDVLNNCTLKMIKGRLYKKKRYSVFLIKASNGKKGWIKIPLCKHYYNSKIFSYVPGWG